MELLDKAGLVKSLLLAKSSKPKPIVVHINTTNTCNLRCPYCYGIYWGRKDVKNFTTEDLTKLFDELAEMGTKRINFGGGEPLTRDDIEYLVGYARKKGMVCNMNSNGHLVREKIEAVKKLNTLCISIDGDEESHDLGKGKGSFKKVLDAIQFAKDNGVNVHTSTAITKQNIHSIDTIFELSKKMGFVTEWLLPFFQTGSGIIAENEDYKKAVQKIIDYKKKGYPIMLSFKSLKHTKEWPDYKKKSMQESELSNDLDKIKCHAGRFMCIIDSSGKVYPCSQMIDTEFPAKNFLEVGFKEAWENLQKHNTCKSCFAFMAFNDYNLMIDRDFSVIMNYFKNTIKERRFKKAAEQN
ncbi:MAG: radical SAM protein [Nanoarchaeota archaeon]